MSENGMPPVFGQISPELLKLLLGQQGGGEFPFSPSYGIEPAPEAPQRSAWDSIAMGLASGLPQMPAARGAGGAFAQGLARGFAMPRAAQVRAREEGAAATAEDRRKQVSEAARELRRFQNEMRLAAMKTATGEDGGLTPEQYEKMGVPKEYRTPAGYKAWAALRQRNDMNIGRLTLAARTNKDISQFPEVRDSFNRIRDSATEGGKTGLSDMALVFSFMRVLDPTSVVREGEYERAVKTSGIPAWVWSAYQRAASGKFLHPDQRADMVRLAGTYYNRKRDAYRNAKEWLGGLAKAYGVDVSLAIPDLERSGVQLGPIDPTMPSQDDQQRDPDGYLPPPPGATPVGGK